MTKQEFLLMAQTAFISEVLRSGPLQPSWSGYAEGAGVINDLVDCYDNLVAADVYPYDALCDFFRWLKHSDDVEKPKWLYSSARMEDIRLED